MSNILDNDSLEKHIKSTSLMKSAEISVYQAYLIKNIKYIDELVENGDVQKNVESIVSKISSVTNGVVKIPLTLDVYIYFGDNGIPSSRYGLVCSIKQSIIYGLIAFATFNAVLIASVCWLADYEIFSPIPMILHTVATIIILISFIISEYSLHDKIKKNH